ncbi:Indole-3-acetic acid-amido synthetase GH3.3 [Quillaja saponaria]|uniref:Indole-3-acetic acid-amido synthetase GH3.3 n=1 Tax=Quillaja saponaria TaxID=32244 RepID=A0AAD7LJS8_QUISA|nr:Indole-3-acetic acid-amido synthetase GH3.3 [Quillaja saponaria]
MRPTFKVVLSEEPESFDENNNMVADYNKKALTFIEEVTSKADEIEKQLLSEILTQNANIEYLQRHGLDGCADRETFKNIIPVVDYENIKPDIDLIANGDTSPNLCYKPISEFFTSSGTSGGECQLIPMTEDAVQRSLLLFSLLMPVMDQFIPGLDKGKGIKFSFIRQESNTPGGLLARPATTSILKCQNLITYRTNYANYMTSPVEVILCPDWYQSMYTQLLCRPSQNIQVLHVGATFASVIFYAIKFLEKHWYRIGDIFLVKGFKNKTPQFSYVCRKNVVLSIDGDKIDGVELQNAVKNAANNLLQFDATPNEYTSYADVSSIPGHYVLYWEINLRGQTQIPDSAFEDCCLAMEESPTGL